MQAERDWLVKRVFPALRQRLEPHRLNLVDIDLRWGITREQADNDQVLGLCLQQIDECRPFFVGLLGGLVSLHLYGATTDPRAAIAWHQVLLRSIPTEADTQQKTASLPAGSLGIVDREFLGWVRLAFANGQTGWVRHQDIVWLYR